MHPKTNQVPEGRLNLAPGIQYSSRPYGTVFLMGVKDPTDESVAYSRPSLRDYGKENRCHGDPPATTSLPLCRVIREMTCRRLCGRAVPPQKPVALAYGLVAAINVVARRELATDVAISKVPMCYAERDRHAPLERCSR